MNQTELDLQPATPEYRTARDRSNTGGVILRHGRWVARATVRGERLHIGCFCTEREAMAALALVIEANAPIPDPTVEAEINRIEVDLSIRCIRLTRGQFAKVDAADFEWLNQWNWCAWWHSRAKVFYAMRNTLKSEGKSSTTVKMHRQIMNAPLGVQVDHIYGDFCSDLIYFTDSGTDPVTATRVGKYFNGIPMA